MWLAGAFFLAGFGWLWWLGVLELYRNADGSVDDGAAAATRTGLLALLVGVGAVGTLWVNSRNLQLTTRTYELTQQGQLTDRFSKANEQLGDESIAVRLGGIYSLKQLAEDTDRSSDQEAVVEVLSAFVRMNFNIRLDESDERRDEYDPASTKRTKPSGDILAAISVLAQLPDRDGILRADFTGVDFSAADLTDTRLKGGNLSGVNLRKAGLAGCNLSGMNLQHADLGWAHLEDVKLVGADLKHVFMRHAYAKGGDFFRADLRDANLSRAMMPESQFAEADLRRANMFDGDVSGSNFWHSKLDHARVDELGVAGALFLDSDLSSVRGLAQYQVDGIAGTKSTKLPPGLSTPSNWT
jgi:uncharacterized protein YjbI with pentapeptide repeats